MILRFITLLLGCLPMILSAQDGIQFQKISLDQAVTLAKAENKDILIDGYASWCGPCKRMDKTTFQDPEIANIVHEKYIPIKLDMEKDEGLGVATRYNIRAYPTFIFLDTSEIVLHKGAGYLKSEDFKTLLDEASNNEMRLGTLQNRFDNGDRDSTLLNNLLDIKFKILDPTYLDVAEARANQSENWDTPEMRSFIYKYINSAASPLFKYMVENKQAFYDQFGQGATFGKIEKLVRDRSFAITETSLSEMNQIFALVYPKQARELSSKYRMSFYRQKGDRLNYATSALDHYVKYPSKDPQELNEVGTTFSRVIDDQALLRQVIPLVEKSIKIEDAHYNNDTLAALLFKLGKINEAQAAAKKAIDLARKTGEDASYTEELLEVIVSHKSN